MNGTGQFESLTNRSGNLTHLSLFLQGDDQARATAKLAFHEQDAKLHQEFQVGHLTRFDLGSFLERADIILASVKSNQAP